MGHGGVRAAGLAAAAAIPLVALSLLPPEAVGTTKSFRPVRVMHRSLIFAPSGVSVDRIARAYLHARRELRGRQTEVRVPVPRARLRRAVSTGSTLRVRRPHGTRTARLTVVLGRRPPTRSGFPGAGTACTFGMFNAAKQPGACWRPYSDASPFNRPLPPTVTQIPNSAAVGARTATFGTGGARFSAGGAGTSADWGHPLYYSQPSDPVYTVHCTESWGTCDVEGIQLQIPNAAKPAGAGDAHMAVIDQRGRWEYDFWQIKRKPAGGGTLVVSWGGRTRIGTPDADGLGAKATASHFGLAAGIIRPEELVAGKINHALFMTVKCTNGTSVWPAGSGTGRSCSQMGLSNANAPAMGAHVYLDVPLTRIRALAIPYWKKAILIAMARYGMYVGDTGSDYTGWTIQIESGSSYTNFGLPDPWATLGRRWDLATWSDGGTNVYVFDLRGTVDWESRLRVARPSVNGDTASAPTSRRSSRSEMAVEHPSRRSPRK
jgi:hypothetical protein